MSENLFIPINETKEEIYNNLLPQVAALIEGENDFIANLANVSAALHETFHWLWVGFYLIKNDELVLGPFQGSVACTRIGYGKGACGTAWKEKKSLLIPNVKNFPGHIICNQLSVAEIVVPIFDANQNIVGVLDIDSDKFDELTEVDVFYLEKICQLITNKLSNFFHV